MSVNVRKPEALPRGVKFTFEHSPSGTPLLEFAMTKDEAIAYACEILDAAGIAEATLIRRGEVERVRLTIGYSSVELTPEERVKHAAKIVNDLLDDATREP